MGSTVFKRWSGANWQMGVKRGGSRPETWPGIYLLSQVLSGSRTGWLFPGAGLDLFPLDHVMFYTPPLVLQAS